MRCKEGRKELVFEETRVEIFLENANFSMWGMGMIFGGAGDAVEGEGDGVVGEGLKEAKWDFWNLQPGFFVLFRRGLLLPAVEGRVGSSRRSSVESMEK